MSFLFSFKGKMIASTSFIFHIILPSSQLNICSIVLHNFSFTGCSCCSCKFLVLTVLKLDVAVLTSEGAEGCGLFFYIFLQNNFVNAVGRDPTIIPIVG